jgi:hypothetical protein
MCEKIPKTKNQNLKKERGNSLTTFYKIAALFTYKERT